MKGTLQNLLDSIQTRRRILLADYSEYELHQLRVGVRRLRGLLRFEDAPDAWQLRREWGYLVSHTNACRDWDTLANRIEALPREEQPVALVDALDERRRQIWFSVRQSLKSATWDEALKQTGHYFNHQPGMNDRPPVDDDRIREAARRLARAWAQVQEQHSNRAWHKLRIAVKDLRYALDASTVGGFKEAIDLCKLLQERLGNWHDCIVHGQLLKALDRELGDNEIAAKHALRTLQGAMKREGKRCLEDASAIMSARETTLSPRQLFQP